MLNSPDDFLVFHLPGNGSQDYLLPNIANDGGEDDQPGVPCVFLLAFFEEGNDISFTPVFGQLSQLPGCIKNY